MQSPNQYNGSPQPSYPQSQYPPQAYPQQMPYSPYVQPGSPQKGQQRPTYRRKRSLSRFQVRMGILGLLGCMAGLYLFVTGHAVNATAGFALIGGGGLVFVLFLLLPLLRR